MTNFKKLSLGLVAATMLATPAMAQVVYQEPGVTGYYPNSAYVTGGYGVRTTPGPGYYYGNRFHPAHAWAHLPASLGPTVPTMATLSGGTDPEGRDF